MPTGVYVRTEQHKANMKAHLKKIMTPEMRIRIAESLKKSDSPERRKAMSDRTKALITPERRKQISDKVKESMTPERRQKISEYNNNRPKKKKIVKVNVPKKPHKWSEETRNKIREINRIKSLNIDFVTTFIERLRRKIEYRQWRSDIYERDNYTCQECSIRGEN